MERFARASAARTPDLAERLQRHEGDPYSLASELVTAYFGKDEYEYH